MDHLFAIFFLDLIVTLIVAKGLLPSHEFARTDWDRQNAGGSGREPLGLLGPLLKWPAQV